MQKLMILKNYLLLSSLVIFISCTKEVGSYSLAQIETNKMFKSVRGGAKFDEVLEEYFYKSNEIVDSKFGYVFYSSIYKNLLSNINESIDSVHLYWNEEIQDVNYYWWAHDTVNCNENLLILFGEDLNNVEYNCFCFADDGSIYSFMPQYNPETDATDWLRDLDSPITDQRSSQNPTDN